MPPQDRYFPGASVSRYLSPVGRSWDSLVFQNAKVLLDCESILVQDAAATMRSLLLEKTAPSGWVRGRRGRDDLTFTVPGDVGHVANSFVMSKQLAIVAGRPVVVEHVNTVDSENLIELDAPPTYGGTSPDVKRADFVFLEVWLALVSYSPSASATVSVLPLLPSAGDTLVIGGVTLTAVLAAPGVGEYLLGGDDYTTASNIVSAVNDPANGIDGIALAFSTSTSLVVLRAVTPGSAGNSTTLTSTGVGLTLSGPTFSGGTDTPNRPTPDTIYVNGCTQAPSGVNLADDLADPSILSETTKRVQVQYRVRVTGQAEAINYKTQPDGFSNPSVLAQGSESAPVAGYVFVPADGSTVSGSTSAAAYGTVDSGLWIAGDGSSGAATDLGTVDGFVYAIPLAMVQRRNSSATGFDPLNNTNGGAPSDHAGFVNPYVGTIPAGVSDRPDGYFPDVIYFDDVEDKRKSVSMTGVDLSSELDFQVKSLLDGRNTTWSVDGADKNTLGAGSGSVGTRFLVCNQVGRSASKGGTSPTSGSTTRGDTIRDFDHVARRFSSAPVVERVVFAIYPTDDSVTYPGKYAVQANGGYSGWAEDDELHLDLTSLNASTLGDFDPATASFTGTGVYPNNASIASFFPPGTVVIDVASVRHDDGSYVSAVSQDVQLKLIEGLGTTHVVLTLDANDDAVDGGQPVAAYRMVGDSGADDGSPRRIFVELVISYPPGSGLTDTPDVDGASEPDPIAYPVGPIIENDTTQRPTDYESILSPAYRSGFREVKVEYVANEPGTGVGSGTPIADQVVSISSTTLRFPRRVWGSALNVVGVTDIPNAQAHDVDPSATEYGSSSRLVTLSNAGGPSGSPMSGDQVLCAITYMAQDAVPNYGALGAGYQVGVYFRSKVKPTVGVVAGAMTALPDPLPVRPLVTSSVVWTGQAGKGSSDLPYPYQDALENIAVNDGGTSTHLGDWYFSATASSSVADFDAETGLLALHGFVTADVTGDLTLQSKTKDAEFRAFYEITDPTAYRPTIMAQPMSSVVRHKVFTPMLAAATADSALFREGEVLLLVFSRFAELDADNSVVFSDVDNRSAVAVYRTRDLLILAGE